jgi:hypothetical protein
MGPVEQVRSKKPWSGRSKLPAVQPLWLNFRTLPWGPEGVENIGKSSYFSLPLDIGFTLFTPIKGRIDSLTVYIYKAEK